MATSSAHGTMGDMPLTLVLGPANSAKAGEVLGAFAAAANRGAILVVPTAADSAHYSRELAAGGAVLGTGVREDELPCLLVDHRAVGLVV